jgi:cytochrome c biogenesis protein CcmG/thiol:disulfide interchange protein DsbE
MRAALPVLAVLLAACAGPRASTPVNTSPLLGKPADIAGTDLAGHEVRVSDAAGKVRIVDFWATWCDPCVEQLPLLDRLQREHGPRGLAVFGVAVDEEREAVRAFLARIPVSFPVLFDPAGEAVAQRLEITRLPTTLVLDRKGVVRDVHMGYGASDGARLEAKILELLAE